MLRVVESFDDHVHSWIKIGMSLVSHGGICSVARYPSNVPLHAVFTHHLLQEAFIVQSYFPPFFSKTAPN